MPNNARPSGGQHEDDGEGDVHAHIAGGDLDVEAEAGVAADPFRDCGADRGVHRGTLEAHEHLRQRGRQADLEEGPEGVAPVERAKRRDPRSAT